MLVWILNDEQDLHTRIERLAVSAFKIILRFEYDFVLGLGDWIRLLALGSIGITGREEI